MTRVANARLQPFSRASRAANGRSGESGPSSEKSSIRRRKSADMQHLGNELRANPGTQLVVRDGSRCADESARRNCEDGLFLRPSPLAGEGLGVRGRKLW